MVDYAARETVVSVLSRHTQRDLQAIKDGLLGRKNQLDAEMIQVDEAMDLKLEGGFRKASSTKGKATGKKVGRPKGSTNKNRAPRGKTRELVIEAVKSAGRPVSQGEVVKIAKEMGNGNEVSEGSIRNTISRLSKDGALTKNGRNYEVPSESNGQASESTETETAPQNSEEKIAAQTIA